jgi:hypothetical protein
VTGLCCALVLSTSGAAPTDAQWRAALEKALPAFTVARATREYGPTQSEFLVCPPPEQEVDWLRAYQDRKELEAERARRLDAGTLSRRPIRVEPQRLRIRLQEKQHLENVFGRLDFTIERLASGENPTELSGDELRLRACSADKSGAVVLEWNGYWIQLVSRCAMHERFRAQFASLVRALKTLNPAAPLPEQVVWSPCGQMAIELQRTADLLAADAGR